MAKIKPTGFTPQNQHPGWVQDPSGQWHPVVAPPPQSTNPWRVIGWIVLAVLLVPCFLGLAVAGITALGASSTTTTTRPPVVTTTTR